MTNKKLITGIDKKENAIQIKGLMSLVVMLGHIAPFMGNFYYILSGGIAVGIFFYYSSFGSRISLKNKNYFKDFFKKKVIKIFIPYIIANDIYFISTVFQKDFKLENSISSVILQIIGLKLSNSVLWYVWHLMGFLVIFYLVEKYLKNQYTYVCMYVAYMILGVLFDIGTWWYTATSCILIGLYYSKKSNQRINFKIYSLIITIYLGTLILGEIYNIFGIKLLPIRGTYYAVGLQIIIIPFFLLANRIILKKIDFNIRLLKFLGNISYEIYLYHMVVWIWINYLIKINQVYIKVFLTVIITIILSCIMKKLNNKIEKIFTN